MGEWVCGLMDGGCNISMQWLGGWMDYRAVAVTLPPLKIYMYVCNVRAGGTLLFTLDMHTHG